ncbi:MAG: HIT family protein [Gammaproteobacteria bacterium]|nr:HIT family protein [Gammaproteobacteria bacterium]MAY02795.1 HIT family protein [Gammaproteobacteria bacterium]|tara:strand:+ start:112 stop:531 length:420 start_codon:yes stop_codon:yes gene_type:complete
MASIFTKILEREIPGHFVWEDEHCFSIMTIQPIREGHLMVIPKMEVNHWDDVPGYIAAHLMQVAQKIAKAMKTVIPCKRIGMSVVGLEVPHTHIHLMPIDNMGDMDFSQAKEASQEELQATAGLIRKTLQARGFSEADI